MRIATAFPVTLALVLLLSTPAAAQNKYLARDESAFHLRGSYARANLAGAGNIQGHGFSGGVAFSYRGILSAGVQLDRLSFDAENEAPEPVSALSVALGFMAVREGEETPLSAELAAVYQRALAAGDDDAENPGISSVSIGAFLSRDISTNSNVILAPELGGLYTPYYSKGSAEPELTGQFGVGIGIEANEALMFTLEPSLAYGVRAKQLTAGLALGLIGAF